VFRSSKVACELGDTPGGFDALVAGCDQRHAHMPCARVKAIDVA
jgi:hypothetical protein